jgi:hypothetical protein
MYADDLLLLAISIGDLQRMVDICIQEFNDIDMTINVKKTVCMRIGQRHNADACQIIINGEMLDWKKELKYLGVNFVSANVIRLNLQSMRQKYFRALNGIFSRVGVRSSPTVILSLVDSFCLPILSYGIETFNIRQADYNCLEAAYNAAFAKIFASFDKNVIRCCQYYCGAMPLNLRTDIKRLKFYCNLNVTRNESIHGLFLLFGQLEFARLLGKHNLQNTGHVGIWKYLMRQTFNKDVEPLLNNDLV